MMTSLEQVELVLVPKEPQERDLSRAEWMRSIGQVIFTRGADELFSDGPVQMPVDHVVTEWAQRQQEVKGTDPMWYRAHDTLITVLKNRRPGHEFYWDIPVVAASGLNNYTHHRTPHNTLSEGIQAQVCFPLNLAQLISQRAEGQGVAGYEVNDYHQMAAMLRRPDFRSMVNTALYTRNAMWQQLSFEKGLPPAELWEQDDMAPISEIAQSISKQLEFSDDGVDFTTNLKAVLLAELRAVNQKGVSEYGQIKGRTSSGCPVAHLRPHFAPNEVGQHTLNELAKHYKVTPEELTRSRETTVIEDGLDFMATILDNLDAYQSGELTTYSSSAQ